MFSMIKKFIYFLLVLPLFIASCKPSAHEMALAEIEKRGEKGENCAEILSTLKAKYDAPEELLKSDLETFLGKLKRLGILEE